jgi:hypothetical protein
MPTITQRTGKYVCNLWEPYAFCYFIATNNYYAIYTYTVRLKMQTSGAYYALTHFTTP